MEGGRIYGHAGVRDYWTRKCSRIDSRVDPLRFTSGEDGRIAVHVHRVVRTGTSRRVEHCPKALTDEVHVLLLEPKTTLNTGNLTSERTVAQLDRL